MEFKTGDKAELRRVVTESDIDAFARLTGDTNPLHTDEAYAQASRFGQRIAHGMFGAALISAALGTLLPGPGTIFISQTLEFLKPVYLDEELRVELEVIEVLEKNVLRIKSGVFKNNDELSISGISVVKAPREQ